VSESGPRSYPWLKTLACPMWIGASVALAAVHFVLASEVGLEIFRRLDGFTNIGGGWTAIGGLERSWTPVVWLSAGAVFFLADRLHLDGLAGAGLILAVCGSITAAVSAVNAARAVCLLPETSFGRYAWKLWVPLALWAGWVPVPFEMTWTYWHTVKY
jgi:DNA-binding transcriptional LysR family regulator